MVVFGLQIFFPQLTGGEVHAFQSGATFIAIRERHLLYLGIFFGEVGGDCTYTVYKDYPAARRVALPRLEDLPNGLAPELHCILVDSTTGIVRGIRAGCPPGFTRTWLAAIHAQKASPYNESEGRKWGADVMSRYPTTVTLVQHPDAVVGTTNEYGERKEL